MSQNQPDGMIPAVRLNGNYDITNVVDIYENKDIHQYTVYLL